MMDRWPDTNPPPASSSAADFLLDRYRVACWEAATGHSEDAGHDGMQRTAKQMVGLLCTTLTLVAEVKSGPFYGLCAYLNAPPDPKGTPLTYAMIEQALRNA